MLNQIEYTSTFFIAALGAFGGWAIVVAALTHYIADLFARRTLQREAGKFSERLADLSHELKLRESAYGKHLNLLLDYYQAFYRHYRICQTATNYDAHKYDDGTVVKTKDTFWENLESYRSEMAALEGSARLLLPSSLLQLHEEGITAFNDFKDVMKRTSYDAEYHAGAKAAFAKVISVQRRMEAGLRTYLRTEHMLSPGDA